MVDVGEFLSCQPNCGKCCDEPGGIVYLRPEDAQSLANHHGMEVEDWLVGLPSDNGWKMGLKSDDTDICIYLDEEKKMHCISIKTCSM